MVLEAYADIGIRIVFSSAIQDISHAHSTPYWCEMMPPEMFAELAGSPPDWKDQVGFIEAQIKRLAGAGSRFHLALGPSGPQRCSRAMLEAVGELSQRYDLPVYTHVLKPNRRRWKAASITHALTARSCDTSTISGF